MLRSAISFGCALFLAMTCWVGTAKSVNAQPLVNPSPVYVSPIYVSPVRTLLVPSLVQASTLETTMARKSLFSFSGKRPTNLGAIDGKLTSCPSSPNCVNSQAPESDLQHNIAPLTYTSSPEDAMLNLKAVVQGMERTEIIRESDNYLYAEFTTPLMGYVDDVEFYLDRHAGVIHVRSASRLGQSDLGLNRKRVEAIRAELAKQQGTSS